MRLAICTKFQVNWMNCVESRRIGGPIDPPLSRLRVTIFSKRLLGLNYLELGFHEKNIVHFALSVYKAGDENL